MATDTGFISLYSLEDYKKNHVARLLKELQNISKGKVNVKESDIEFQELEEEN